MKLIDAIRKKHKTPERALAALGLDDISGIAMDAAADGDNKEKLTMPKIKLSPAALVAHGALMTYITPRLAQDSKIDIKPALAGVTAKNFKERRPFITAAIRTATHGNLAKDADLEDLPDMLSQIENLASEASEAIDPAGAAGGNEEDPPGGQDDDLSNLVEMIKALSPEDRARLDEMITHTVDPNDPAVVTDPDDAGWDKRAADARARLGRDETEEERKKREDEEGAKDAKARLGRDETPEEAKKRMEAMDARRARGARDTIPVNKAAMDAAIQAAVAPAVNAAVLAAVAQTTKQQIDIREAERVVRPFVGDTHMAFDSAEGVYRNALKLLDVQGHDTIHESALRTVLEMQPKPRSGSSNIATDAAPPKDSFATRFPFAQRVERM